MKAYIIGDLQAHAWKQFETDTSQVNSRLMDLINELKRIRQLAVKNKVTNVFILGDVFEERGKIDVVVLNMLYREFLKFKKQNIKVITLVGNHDKVPLGDFHSLEVFQDVCTVCDEPTVYKFRGAKVLAIPFQAESKDTVKALKKFGRDVDMILMHTAVRGAKLDSGKTWDEGIRLKHIPKKPYVFMGHDHSFKQLRKRVWYVGSLLHVDWGDAGKEKFFVEWNSKNKPVFHHTEGPVFKQFKVPETTRLKKTLRSLKNCSGNFVRIYYAGSFTDFSKIKRIVTRLLKARYVEVFPETHILTAEELHQTINYDLDPVLKKYVKKLPKSIRKEAFILGKDILKRVA